jgi:hypothetical protein
MTASRKSATAKEILIIAGVLTVLLILVIVFFRAQGGSDDMLQTLTNMRQLQVATQVITVDNQAQEKPIQWTTANGKPISYAQWTNALAGANLNPQDIRRLLSARSQRLLWSDKVTENAITVFAVTDSDPKNTLFLVTKNWHGLEEKKLSGDPYGAKGFIVMRKGGDGVILSASQSQNADTIGAGGTFHFLPLK